MAVKHNSTHTADNQLTAAEYDAAHTVEANTIVDADIGAHTTTKIISPEAKVVFDGTGGHAHGGGTDGKQVDHGGLGGLTDDDHTQYQKESEKDTASGYAGLNASTEISTIQLPLTVRTLPLSVPATAANVVYGRDGDYLYVETTATGLYPALQAGRPTEPLYDSKRTLIIQVTIKLYSNQECHVLFAEPYKGDYNNYLGFLYVPNTVRMLTRKGGTETRTDFAVNIGDAADHVFKIEYQIDSVKFYIDGTLRATHITNISPPPHNWACCEPNATILKIGVKYPFLEILSPGALTGAGTIDLSLIPATLTGKDADTVDTKHYSDISTEIDSDVSTHAALTAIHGATGAIVGTTNTQTLSAKTLTTPKVDSVVEETLNNGVSVDGVKHLDSYEEFDEVTAPGTPAANKIRLYAKDKAGVSELYYKNDGGTERDLSAGGGGVDPAGNWFGAYLQHYAPISFSETGGTGGPSIAREGSVTTIYVGTGANYFGYVAVKIARDYDNSFPHYDKNPQFEAVIKVDTVAADTHYYLLFGGVFSATHGWWATAANKKFGVHIDASALKIVSSDGTTQSESASLMTLVAGTTYRIRVKLTSALNVEVWVDGVSKGTKTTNLPAGAGPNNEGFSFVNDNDTAGATVFSNRYGVRMMFDY